MSLPWSLVFVARSVVIRAMYLRYTTRKKDGKTHRYWRLVQSVRRRVIAWSSDGRRTTCRTVATRIAEALGIGGEQLIEKVFGHSDGIVTAIYNRYGYVGTPR
jgi:hypothetical protein